MALAPGAHVRHRSRPAWGIGRVLRVPQGDGPAEFVVDFEAEGEKKLRVAEDAFELVPAAEIAARDAAAEARKKAAQSAARQVSRQRNARTIKLMPSASLAGSFGSLGAMPDGELVVSTRDAVQFYDDHGTLRREIAAPHAYSNDVLVHGEFLVLKTTHGSDLLLVDRGAGKAWRWQPARPLIFPKIAAAGPGRFVVATSESLHLIEQSGACQVIPFTLPEGGHLSQLRVGGEALILELFWSTPRPGLPQRQLLCVGLDGALRWSRAGQESFVFPDGRLVYVDQDVVAADARGEPVGLVPGVYPLRGSIPYEADSVFARSGDDLLFCDVDGVTCWRPSERLVRWRLSLPERASLQPPRVVGPTVVVAAYGHDSDRRVWFLDAATGVVRHLDEGVGEVRGACAIGDDAYAIGSFSKRIVGWRHLRTTPERLIFSHPDHVFELCSPCPGSLVTSTHDQLTFWHL